MEQDLKTYFLFGVKRSIDFIVSVYFMSLRAIWFLARNDNDAYLFADVDGHAAIVGVDGELIASAVDRSNDLIVI